MPESSFDPSRLTALIFDLDGTLYRQDTLRRAMLVRLVQAHALRPWRGLRTAQVLSAYRRAQEHLRDATESSADLAAAQLEWACARTGMDPDAVADCVDRWMDQEPLKILARHTHTGLVEFLRDCKARGLQLGIVSDYPADAKLRALGLADFFEVVVTAQSPDVGRFKPHPRGLQLAMERLGVNAAACAYVGDRPEVDAAAAAAAGLACFILMRRGAATTAATWTSVASFDELRRIVLQTRPEVAQPLLDRR